MAPKNKSINEVMIDVMIDDNDNDNDITNDDNNNNNDEELGVVVAENINENDDDNDDENDDKNDAVVVVVGGGNKSSMSSMARRSTNTKNNAPSSFFLLNKNNNRTIPQIKIILKDVTYQPITSSTSTNNASNNASKTKTKSSNNNNNNKKEDQNHNQKQQQNRTIVLNKINTTINPFELTAWMGPSGSGKTSLVSVVAGLIVNDNNGNNDNDNDNDNDNNNDNDITKESQINCIKMNNNNNVDAGIAGQQSSTTATANTNTNTNTNIVSSSNSNSSIPKHMIGIVWQDDLLLNQLTVEETIYFAARLKTPSTISDTKVNELVYETMKELGLELKRTSIISSISGGERKRVSVGVELVVRPSLLICDEPTSGLDSSTSYKLIITLKELTSLGHSIAVVIHQPRTDIFNMFDHLLLLSKGNVIYNDNACNVRSYLENIGTANSSNTDNFNSSIVHPLPPETGIADWIMDTIIDDEQNQMLSMVNNNNTHDNEDDDNDNEDGEDDDGDGRRTYKSLADYWTEHRRLLMVVKDSSLKEEEGGGGDIGGGSNSISSIRRRTLRNSSSLLSETISTQFRRNNGSENNKNENNSNNNNMYEASYRKEFVLLINRISKQQRGERLTRVTFFLTILYLIFTSFMWWQIPNNTSNVFEKNSLIFFLLIAQGNSIVTSSISVFNRERTLLKRERAKKMYRVLPFFLAKAVSDMTNNIVLPISYGIISYWTAGLRPSLGSFLKFTFGYWLSLSSAQSMGFFLSILIPNMNVALILAPPITLFCFILAGFYIPISSMHITMKYLSYLSFARYGYCALLINEFENRLIPCSTNNDESSSSGITVGEINECPLPGNNVYESIGIDGIFANYWFNILILAIFQMLFMVGAYILLRRSK